MGSLFLSDGRLAISVEILQNYPTCSGLHQRSFFPSLVLTVKHILKNMILLCLQKVNLCKPTQAFQSGHYMADMCRYADSKFLQIVEFLPAWRQSED